MRSGSVLLCLWTLTWAHNAHAQDPKPSPYPTVAPIAQYRMNVQDEIALARSAAPPSISADAEVLVLGSRGYETAVKGTNGFTCFVMRSWAGGLDDAEFWNPKGRGPNCFNPAAVHSVLPQYVARAEWVMTGSTKQQLAEKAQAAVASGRFTVPEAGSFSFMLSKDGYLNDETAGPWLPHVMFFIPHGQAAAWGAGKAGSPVLGQEGSAFEPTVLFVPVRAWSDGSPAPPLNPPDHKM